MSGHYSFFKLEEESVIFYNFITPEAGYTVYFNSEEYAQYLDAYPNLLQEGCGFGFIRQDFTKSKRTYDPKVLDTIMVIIKDFYTESSGNPVLLYHCDPSDGKQLIRSKLFMKWEKQLIKNGETLFTRNTLEIERCREKYKTSEFSYLGIVFLTENPSAKEITQEFENFGNLVIPK